jgi:hypothetical protein
VKIHKSYETNYPKVNYYSLKNCTSEMIRELFRSSTQVFARGAEHLAGIVILLGFGSSLALLG